MFTVAHEVPCRLRLVAAALRTDSGRAAAWRQQLLACPGVTRAEVRPATGSLVVFHDGAPESRNAVLRALGLPVTPYRAAGVQFPLLDAVVEATMRRLLAYAAQAVVATVL